MQSLVDHYLAEHEKYHARLPASQVKNLKLWQLNALESFAKEGLPSARSEAWQYTAAHPLMKRPFQLIHPVELAYKLDKTSLQSQFPPLSETPSLQLLFMNGRFMGTLSALEKDEVHGISIQSFSDLSQNQAEYLLHHWTNTPVETDSLSTLNRFLSQDGAVIEIAPNCKTETPIELLFLSDMHADLLPNYALIPIRNLIRVAKHSHVTFVERYHSLDLLHLPRKQYSARDQGKMPLYCTNAVTELTVESGATCKWYHKTQENPLSVHIGQLKAMQHAHSQLSTYSVNVGNALLRRTWCISLEGEGAMYQSKALSMSTQNQCVDHQITVTHQAPYTESDVHYRMIANEQSRGIFRGDVQVNPGVFKIKAKQNNHNLLLSPEAEIDSKPRLTILAEDVACTHGATIGQLDEDALFYLRTRGIPIEVARTILMMAFGESILSEMPIMISSAELQTALTHEIAL